MKPGLAFTLLLFLTISLTAQNPCGVKAVIAPFGDSVFTAPTLINFQSASINATDYKFIFEPYEYPLNQSANWGISPGLLTVKLIAYNGTCTDTAVAYYFYPGKFPAPTDNSRRLYGYSGRDQEITNLLHPSTGGYLIAGHRDYSYYFHENQQGLLIKTKEEGCVEWGRKLTGVFASDIIMVKEAAGGGYYILATLENSNYYIAKLDANGNAQWTKQLGIAGNNLFLYGMQPMPDGGVVVTGGPYGSSRLVVIRMDNNGNTVWQKECGYNFNTVNACNNVLLKDNFLYVGGFANYNNYTEYASFLTKIDYTSSQTIWTKMYSGATNPYLGEMVSADATLLVNLRAGTGRSDAALDGGYMQVDTSGNIIASSLVTEGYSYNTLVGPYTPNTSHLVQSGKSFYILSAGSLSLGLYPGIGFATKMIRIDSTYNTAWVETSGGAGIPDFYYNAPALNDGLAIGGNEVGSSVSVNSIGTLLSLRTIDSSGGNTNANCNFGKQDFTVMPADITTQSIQWITDQPANYTSTDNTLPLSSFYPELRFKCPDYIDSCSYLKLSGPQSVCNLGQDYIIKSHKNRSCGQPTQWTVPPAASIVLQTDSSVTLRFPAFGRYVIYGANPLSCVPVQDSLVVIAASKTPPLDLGPDRQICVNNTTILHAGKHFLSYEWQDGSADSTLSVNQPGMYWVKVTDSCENILRDTLLVTLAPPIPFSAGPDRIKCNSDTVKLQAPPGFMNYSWQPAYNITSTTAQTVVVNPVTDTLYIVKAEKTPGCFAYDTVRITVNHSPLINLGNDTSFCAGDSIVLNAGTGFQQYAWSNGGSTQTITASLAGTYAVIATTTEACRSYDTLKVMAVFALPVPNLGSNDGICIAATRDLNPGTFSSYLWQDGSTGPVYTVSNTGEYYVTVTNNHQCMGSDTLIIRRVLPPPSQFLPVDTSICNYGKLELKTNTPYNSYAWSNGASTASITIAQQGTYWLQVTDENNCVGKDTVIVTPKDCLLGLYVPNAFSPNHDGKNDVFHPLLFGNIKLYRFIIYNRWGQPVFNTTDPKAGWDGSMGGRLQDNNVFIWTCFYQLEGQEPKTEKGTVVLLK